MEDAVHSNARLLVAPQREEDDMPYNWGEVINPSGFAAFSPWEDIGYTKGPIMLSGARIEATIHNMQPIRVADVTALSLAIISVGLLIPQGRFDANPPTAHSTIEAANERLALVVFRSVELYHIRRHGVGDTSVHETTWVLR